MLKNMAVVLIGILNSSLVTKSFNELGTVIDSHGIFPACILCGKNLFVL